MNTKTKELLNCLKYMTKFMKKQKPELPEHGKLKELTLEQFEVFVYICEHKKARMSDIAKEANVKLPTMTDIIEKLVKKGFVERHRDEQDRRTVWITIAKDIENIAKKAMKKHEAYLEKLLSVLTEEEKTKAIEIINKIINRLKEGVR